MNVAEQIVEALLESVAVDLDGTLAKDNGWKGAEHIGEPIKPMLDLVRKLLDDGEEVVIFTARVHDGEKSTKEHIAQWLKDHGLPDLEITNEKRPDMEKFYDDKAVAVEKNKGVSESVTKRAFLVSYQPKRGYRSETLVCIIDGNFSPAQVTRMIRQGAEQLAGRRLSWSRGDLNIQMDSECDPEKARLAPDVPKLILGQDGLQVLPA